VTDHFAVLGFPRRPHIDPSALKSAYLAQAARLHPDSANGDDARFTELQEAHRVLGQPALRIRHLIELTSPDTVVGNTLPTHSTLLFALGSALQRVKNAVQHREKATTALGRAVAAGEVSAARQALTAAQAPLAQVETEIFAELTALDARWPDVTTEELSTLARELSFLARWKGEVAEWEFRLVNG
jgi:DnaJ domain